MSLDEKSIFIAMGQTQEAALATIDAQVALVKAALEALNAGVPKAFLSDFCESLGKYVLYGEQPALERLLRNVDMCRAQAMEYPTKAEVDAARKAHPDGKGPVTIN